MTNFVTAPNILWRIENFVSVHKTLSPIIMFAGLKFHLSFSQFMESGQVKYQLILDCQNVPQKPPPWQFKIDASILYTDDCCFLGKSGEYKLMHNQWCVWSDFAQNIYKKIGQMKDITFLVNVAPTANSVTFTTEEFVEETKNSSPCAISLCKNIGKLFNDEKESDFTLKCGNVSYKLHKAILSARSEYFAGMFRSDMRENEEKKGKIEDIEPDILEIVLRYMYTGEISELSTSTSQKVYAVADMLLLEPLKAKCCSLIIDNFATNTVEGNKTDRSGSDDQQSETSDESNDSKERQILADLFRSREWRIFSQEFPHKAQTMLQYV